MPVLSIVGSLAYKSSIDGPSDMYDPAIAAESVHVQLEVEGVSPKIQRL